MAMNVRRIVTGHNASGKAVIKTDEQIAAVPRIGAGISGAEIWSTNQMPIDNSASADAAQRAGFVKHTNYVGDGGGTTFRINVTDLTVLIGYFTSISMTLAAYDVPSNAIGLKR